MNAQIQEERDCSAAEETCKRSSRGTYSHAIKMCALHPFLFPFLFAPTCILSPNSHLSGLKFTFPLAHRAADGCKMASADTGDSETKAAEYRPNREQTGAVSRSLQKTLDEEKHVNEYKYIINNNIDHLVF